MARDCWAAGETNATVLRDAMRRTLAEEPLAAIDYVSVADADTLQELETVDRPALLSLAVRFDEVRLIDNELLDAGTGGSRAV